MDDNSKDGDIEIIQDQAIKSADSKDVATKKEILITLHDTDGVKMNVTDSLNIIEVFGALELCMVDIQKKLFVDPQLKNIDAMLKAILANQQDENNPLVALAHKLNKL